MLMGTVITSVNERKLQQPPKGCQCKQANRPDLLERTNFEKNNEPQKSDFG